MGGIFGADESVMPITCLNNWILVADVTVIFVVDLGALLFNLRELLLDDRGGPLRYYLHFLDLCQGRLAFLQFHIREKVIRASLVSQDWLQRGSCSLKHWKFFQ